MVPTHVQRAGMISFASTSDDQSPDLYRSSYFVTGGGVCNRSSPWFHGFLLRLVVTFIQREIQSEACSLVLQESESSDRFHASPQSPVTHALSTTHEMCDYAMYVRSQVPPHLSVLGLAWTDLSIVCNIVFAQPTALPSAALRPLRAVLADGPCT